MMDLQDELRRRRRLLGADVRALGADALLLTREGAVTYTTGYTTSTWSNFSRPILVLLFPGEERVVVLCAETEADAVQERVPDCAVRPYGALVAVTADQPLPDGCVQFAPAAAALLATVVRERGVRRLAVDGLDAAFPPIAQLTRLVPALAGATVDASGVLWARRLVKSPWEIARLRAAAGVLEQAFARLERELRPGLSERQIHGVLGSAILREGADGLGYVNIVAGTERGLFGAPTVRVWQAGEVLYVDGGAILDGYWADFCRMYVAGAPSPRQREGYRRAREGLARALAAFRPGMTAGALGAASARAVGLPPHGIGFGRFGHGIGLYMPEPPSLHPDDPTVLGEGMVLCIEPAVRHAGANFVVEEEHAVIDRRLERLSPAAPDRLIDVAS